MQKIVNEKRIAISAIKLNPDALREVNPKREEYVQLRGSIEEHGVLQAIAVREIEDEEGSFVLIDGAHRYTCAKELGHADIRCVIYDADDMETYTIQLVANAHQVETRPAEFAKHLQRMLARDMLMTVVDLGKRIHKAPSWIHARLRLNNLTDQAKKLVNEGEIVVTNGMALATLPVDEQNDWIEKAMTDPPGDFRAAVDARVKAVRAAKRAGKDPNAKAEWAPVAKLRKTAELRLLLEDGGSAVLSGIYGAAETAEEVATSVVKWALHLDDESVAEQKSKAVAKTAANDKAKVKAKFEREKKRQAAASDAMAKAKEEADKAGVEVG